MVCLEDSLYWFILIKFTNIRSEDGQMVSDNIIPNESLYDHSPHEKTIALCQGLENFQLG